MCESEQQQLVNHPTCKGTLCSDRVIYVISLSNPIGCISHGIDLAYPDCHVAGPTWLLLGNTPLAGCSKIPLKILFEFSY